MGQQSPIKSKIVKKLSELAGRLTLYQPSKLEQPERMIEKLDLASHVDGYLSSKELQPPK